MISVKDMADALDVGAAHVRKLLRAGAIPGAVLVGEGRRGLWRIPRAAGLAFIATFKRKRKRTVP